MATRVTGLTSGLDTEALVSAMVMNYRAKATKSQQAQSSLKYKLDALKTVNSDVHSLYQSVDKLRWSSAYSLKSTTVSDSTKAKVTASDTAVNGTQTLEIKELAQAGYLTGGNIKSNSKLASDTKLSDIYTEGASGKNSFAGGSITVSVGGKEKNIELTEDMTAQELVSKLKDAGLNASFDASNGRFFISSKSSGAENDFKLVANNADGLASLKSLGLYSADEDSKAEYQKWADYSNMSDDEWKSFVDNQYASKSISYDSRANSYASQYNTAKSALEKAQSNAKAVFDTFTEDEQQDITSAADAKNKAETLKLGRDTDARFAAYRTEVEDKDEDGNVIGTRFEYNTKAMKEARDSGTLSQEEIDALDELEKLNSDISKFEKAADKLFGYEKTILEQETKIADLTSKVNLETDDAGNVTKAVALKEGDVGYDALIAEVDTDNANARQALDEALRDRVTQSQAMLADISAGGASEGAVRIKGQDAKIELNGAIFTNSTNAFSINGLSIEATGKTDGPITITTATDSQGIYDKIKDLLSQYNDVMSKMSKYYNAASAKGYDPLTEDQKKEMSESEINLWETKVKDSILRRDSTLSSIMNSLTSAMSKSFDIDGKSYSLSSFGIKTAGYFSTDQKSRYNYHIDGDSDDAYSSGNSDKLMAAIVSDPDKVVDFFQKLSNSVYDSLNAKMKSTSLSSAYTIYNDKEMASEYSDYTKTIAKWQDQVSSMEEYYYKKYAAMESTLTKLQSQTGQLSSYFG